MIAFISYFIFAHFLNELNFHDRETGKRDDNKQEQGKVP
jgi:hypothetical protein